MLRKTITPKQHGINDWLFAAGLFGLTRLVGINKRAQAFYDIMGANVVAINAATDHGAGPLALLSMADHKKLDIANLALLYGMFASKMIRNDKRAVAFNIGLVALATLNVLKTDYQTDSNRKGKSGINDERDLTNPGRQTDQPLNHIDQPNEIPAHDANNPEAGTGTIERPTH